MNVLNLTPDMNVRACIRDFLAQCEGQSDVRICFAPGEYDFINPQAVADWQDVLFGKVDYDTLWGRTGKPYNTEIVLRNLKNVTVEGYGAMLWMEGLTAALTVEACEHVTLKGFSINWRRPHFTLAGIEAIEDEWLTLRLSHGFTLEGGEVVWGLYDYDPMNHECCHVYKFRGMSPLLRQEDGTFRLNVGKTAARMFPGMQLILRHVGNYRPIIHLLHSSDIRLEDVTVYTGPGMGVIGHYSKDITFRRFSVRPWENRVMSTTTDSTHFISCSGLIDYEDCYFEGAGDDAVNVHGFYLKVAEIIDDYTLRTGILRHDGTQDQVCDAPQVGEMVAFYPEGEQNEFAQAELVEADVNEDTWDIRLKFKEPVCAKLKPGDMLTQCSNVAALRFHRCHVRSQRARGVLSQTRNVLIEGCLFELLSGTAIHVESDLVEGWYESIAARNVVIRDNTMRRCGYADGTYQNASGVAIESGETDNSVGVHKNILVEGNRITGCGATGIAVMNASEVTVRENDVMLCETGIDVCASDCVTLENNALHGAKVRWNRAHTQG